MPRTQSRTSVADQSTTTSNKDKIATSQASSSMYDNMGTSSSLKRPSTSDGYRSGRGRSLQNLSSHKGMSMSSQTLHSRHPIEDTLSNDSKYRQDTHKDEKTPSRRRRDTLQSAKSVDYSDMNTVRETDKMQRTKSKSTDNVMTETSKSHANNNSNSNNNNNNNIMSLDSNALKKMLKPMSSVESPITSPEPTRRRQHQNHNHSSTTYDGYISEPDSRHSRFQSSKSAYEIGQMDRIQQFRNSRNNRFHLDVHNGDLSPSSDNAGFDYNCYATTPSSSNGNSDLDPPLMPPPAARAQPSSPTSRLLMEYEMHLRNTLAKGMDAESYSLHTFESLLTQSMENIGERTKTIVSVTAYKQLS